MYVGWGLLLKALGWVAVVISGVIVINYIGDIRRESALFSLLFSLITALIPGLVGFGLIGVGMLLDRQAAWAERHDRMLMEIGRRLRNPDPDIIPPQ